MNPAVMKKKKKKKKHEIMNTLIESVKIKKITESEKRIPSTDCIKVIGDYQFSDSSV